MERQLGVVACLGGSPRGEFGQASMRIESGTNFTLAGRGPSHGVELVRCHHDGRGRTYPVGYGGGDLPSSGQGPWSGGGVGEPLRFSAVFLGVGSEPTAKNMTG